MKPQPRSAGGGAVLPAAALIVAMISIQYGATYAKGLFPLVGAEGTTALRLCAAAVMLGLVMRPWRARVRWGAVPALVGYGASLGVMNLLFYMALSRIPLGIAVALEFTGPLLVAVISSRRAIDFGFVGLAVGGLFLLSPSLHGGQALNWAGVGLALGAGACWALYIVFGQASGGELGTQTTAIGTLIAAVLVLPVGVAQAGWALLHPPVLFGALVVGFFSSALPYSLEMVALTRMKARVYGVMTSIEPALGALMGLMVLHEHLSAAQWVGIAAVAAAALGTAATSAGPAIGPE
jgi:inner membrane transporter RhtA